MISYSVAMSLAIITVLLFIGSVEYLTILQAQFNTPLFYAILPTGLVLIISCVAELGRPPLDL